MRCFVLCFEQVLTQCIGQVQFIDYFLSCPTVIENILTVVTHADK